MPDLFPDHRKRDANQLKTGPMLSVQHLDFQYERTPVLRGVSFQVPPGRLCGLFGPNGSGKTTLFRCCLNFLSADAGAVIVDGTPIADLPAPQLARRIAYVPQEHALSFPYTVKEVVLMGRTPHLGGAFGIGAAHRTAVLEALCLLGIADLAERPFNQLSGGQRQLTLIARAIAQQTPLLLLDEPTASLDFDNQLRIWRLLQQLRAQGKTILVATHNPNHVLWFCDQVIVMGQGGILSDGPPAQALTGAVLEQLYGRVCRVLKAGEWSVVVPADG